MRIAQIVLPQASLYERKSHRVDAAHLEIAGDGELTHIYGARALIIEAPARWWQRARKIAAAPVESDGITLLPEAVEDAYFTVSASGTTVGSIMRPSVKNMIEQTMHRLARTRDDIEWRLFDSLPTAEEIAQIGVWVDPAVNERDFDGGTAEALAAGCLVVASRTAINRARCEEGRSGTLVPTGDPNEMTHAILSALFKPESGLQRAAAARQTIGKFKARQRMRVLMKLHESLKR